MKNCRILANNQYRGNNTWETGLNNNDLIIGPSGAGKTRNYVKPNLMQCNESMVITDTKGTLYGEIGSFLEEQGYEVILIDCKNLSNSYGYNPFDYIRYDTVNKRYNEQDILTVSSNLAPIGSKDDPYWDLAARMYLSTLISYCLETMEQKDHNLESVYNLFTKLVSGEFASLMQTHQTNNPKSFAVQQYRMFSNNNKAEKMHSSIIGILAEKINTLLLPELIDLYTAENRINFLDLEKKKTAVFMTVSDTDRSMDRLISLFYAQALNTLCNVADNNKGGRLQVPVRFYLDDFATNTIIADFDNIISVIRSREIYVSIILQSISQLNAIYGVNKAKTIINNCDNCLYLGGQDVETADFMAVKSNKSINDILTMPLDKAYLFTRGTGGKEVAKFNIKDHEKYTQLPEYADFSNEANLKQSTAEENTEDIPKEAEPLLHKLLSILENKNKDDNELSSQYHRLLAQL